jgi:hypothetical protein
MKIKYIILIVVSLLIITLIYFMVYHKKMEIKNIKSFYLTYTKGYAMNAYVTYELNYDIDKNEYVASIKPYGISDEDKLKVTVNKDFSEKIKDVLVKYHVENWNGFNKNDKNVLDGDSFSISITMKNGDDIHASGYMRWPDNYKNVVNEIDNIFMDIYNSNK